MGWPSSAAGLLFLIKAYLLKVQWLLSFFCSLEKEENNQLATSLAEKQKLVKRLKSKSDKLKNDYHLQEKKVNHYDVLPNMSPGIGKAGRHK